MKITLLHLQKIKNANNTDMQQICELIGWGQEQYCRHQFFVYDSVLSRRFFGQPACLLNQAMYSDLMSGFFNNEWSKRNQTEFLPFAQEHSHFSQSYVCPKKGLRLEWDCQSVKAFLADEYLYCHNPYLLANDEIFLSRLNYTLNLIFKP